MEIYNLENNDYTAAINLSRGANCISLRNRRYRAKILREPDYSAELDNPYLYGMPILFPVNRISEGKFEFEGRWYRFPINELDTQCHLHGMLHNADFQLLERSNDRLVCSYKADEKHPYLLFPHSFEIRMTYQLSENGLSHEVTVSNFSKDNMPCMIGFHTTFNSLFTEHSKQSDIKVQADIIQEVERNMDNYLPTGRILDFDGVSIALKEGVFSPFSERISRHYQATDYGHMVIYDAGQDLSVVYENSNNMRFCLIYNGDASSFICLEPQNCMVNCANGPIPREVAGFQYIEPGEAISLNSRIYVAGGDRRHVL